MLADHLLRTGPVPTWYFMCACSIHKLDVSDFTKFGIATETRDHLPFHFCSSWRMRSSVTLPSINRVGSPAPVAAEPRREPSTVPRSSSVSELRERARQEIGSTLFDSIEHAVNCSPFPAASTSSPSKKTKQRPSTNHSPKNGRISPTGGSSVSPYNEEGRLRAELKQLRQRVRELVAESKTPNMTLPYWQMAKRLMDQVVNEYYANVVMHAQTGSPKSDKPEATARSVMERTAEELASEGQALTTAFPWLRSAQELGMHELEQARDWYVGRVDDLQKLLATARANEEQLSMELSALSAMGAASSGLPPLPNRAPAASGVSTVSRAEHMAKLDELRVEHAAALKKEREAALEKANRVAKEVAEKHAEAIERQVQARLSQAATDAQRALDRQRHELTGEADGHAARLVLQAS